MTLKWVGGVASRGKQKGLALPIATTTDARIPTRDVRQSPGTPSGNTSSIGITSSTGPTHGYPSSSGPAPTAEPALTPMSDTAGQDDDASPLLALPSDGMSGILSNRATATSTQLPLSMPFLQTPPDDWNYFGLGEDVALPGQQNNATQVPRPPQEIWFQPTMPCLCYFGPLAADLWGSTAYRRANESPEFLEDFSWSNGYLGSYAPSA